MGRNDLDHDAARDINNRSTTLGRNDLDQDAAGEVNNNRPKQLDSRHINMVVR